MKRAALFTALIAATPALADTEIDTAVAGARGGFAAQVALTTTVELKPARADYKPSPALAQPLCKPHMRPADQRGAFWIDGPEAPRGTRYELCDYIGTVSVIPYQTATPTFEVVYLTGPIANATKPNQTTKDETMNKAVIAAAALTLATATVPAMASCGCPTKTITLTAPVPVVAKPTIPTVITPIKVVAVTPKLTVPTVTVMRDGKTVTKQDRGTNYNPLNVIAKNDVAYTAPRYYVSRDGNVTQTAININAPHNPKNIVAPK